MASIRSQHHRYRRVAVATVAVALATLAATLTPMPSATAADRTPAPAASGAVGAAAPTLSGNERSDEKGDKQKNDKPAAASTVLVGEIEGTDALIALVVGPDGVVAYTCGGPTTWRDHTGWFATSLTRTDNEHPGRGDDKKPEGTLVPATSGTGIKLTGKIDEKTAEGTITLKDGTVRRWSAERAKGNRAGLAALDTNGQLTGLIVTNDGKAAGTSRLTTSDLTTVSAPVTTTGTPTVTSPTVTTTLPGPTTTTLVLVPITLPGQLTIQRTGPTVIVMMHGATDPVPPDAAGIAADGLPGTRKHARRYWTAPFVASLLGATSANAPLTTLTGTDVTGNRFLTDALGANPDTLPPSTSCDLDDFVTALPFTAASTAPPQLAAVLYHRDTTRGLIQSAIEATDQVTACLDAYTRRFGVKPGVVFVNHSLGGPILRLMLSAPTRASLNNVINASSGERLEWPADPAVSTGYDSGTLSTRVKMNTIRDATIYAVTIGSPHEGVRVMEAGAPVHAAVSEIRNSAPVTFLAQALDALASSTSLLVQMPTSLLEGLIYLDDLMNRDRILEETRVGMFASLNAGPIHPSLARRSGASPLAGGASNLIPIYTLGGRSPGSTVFDSPSAVDIINAYNATASLQQSKRVRFWLLLTSIGDTAYQVADTIAPKAVPAGAQPKLDVVERIDRATLTTTLINTVLPSLDPFFKAQFGSDMASVQRFLNPTPALPIFLRTKYRMDLGGSVTIPVPTLSCVGANPVQLRDETTLRWMRTAFGDLSGASTRLGTMTLTDFSALVQRLSLSTFNALTSFFSATINTITSLPSTCLNPANWTLRFVNVAVPAPRFVATGTPTSDGHVDDDGLIEYDSAMGFRLGTSVDEFFDHTRTDFVVSGVARPGSWYRQYTSGAEPFSHDQMRGPVGSWVWTNIVSQGPGPIAGPAALSTWPA